jgi:hypothetical protein
MQLKATPKADEGAKNFTAVEINTGVLQATKTPSDTFFLIFLNLKKNIHPRTYDLGCDPSAINPSS